MEMDKKIQISTKGLWKKLSHSGWLPRFAFFWMILMKVFGVLTWSWWIVLAPLWMIPVAAGIVLIVSGLVGITYPIWEPVHETCKDILREYKRDRKLEKQPLATVQSVSYLVKRALKFLFLG